MIVRTVFSWTFAPEPASRTRPRRILVSVAFERASSARGILLPIPDGKTRILATLHCGGWMVTSSMKVVSCKITSRCYLQSSHCLSFLHTGWSMGWT